MSELFLFLTPHVVFSDEDLDRVRDGIGGRAKLIEGELRKSPPALPEGSVRATPAPPPAADTTGRRP